MADISVEKSTNNNMSRIWAAAAIIAVLGLMVWLFSTQETTQVVTETVAEAETEEVSAAESAELAAIGADPDSFAGREVRVEGVEVAAVLGDRGFWAEVPGANPFLVIVSPDVADVAWIEAGATATVEGSVEPVTEEVVEGWVQNEVIREQASAEAAFATHYLQVVRVEQ